MKKDIQQINIKIDKSDLAFLDAKAKRYGISRSAMLKYFGLNAEFDTKMQEQLRSPNT
jgi:hypothetical protein